MNRNTRCNGRETGLTLLELMIVVAVVGLLAAIAYPAYTEQVARGRRADAKTVLLEAAQFMERNFTEAGAYNRDAGGAAITTGSGSLPAGLREAPREGTNKFYDITIATIGANNFTLRATRKGGQASDKCGNFELTNTGTKSLNSASAGQTVDTCWNR
jgi:type IV pilus assembly protein PilE